MSRSGNAESDASRRTFLTAAGSAAATVALAGCTNNPDEESPDASPTDGGDGGATPTDSPEDGGDGTQSFPVTITQGTMPGTLDPHDHRALPNDIVMIQCYEGLLRRTKGGRIEASLATDWERKEEGRVRFHIREGPTFQKTGNELKPEDVAYTINRIVKKSVGFTSPQAGQLAGVTGAEVVDGERAVDVMSDGLNPTVFAKFAIYCDVMEKQWTKEHDKSYIAQNMNGTGPFELSEYESGVRVVFDRYDDYWQEPADITKLTFNAAKKAGVRVNQLVAGETDLTVNVPPQSVSRVEDDEDARIAAVGSTRVIYNAMRYDVEPFSSPEFRRAMNYAVDLGSIVDDVLQGFGGQTGQPTLQPFFGYEPDVGPYEHDPEQAEQLVEESGHAGAEITLHTPVGRYLKDVQIAQAVAGMIDQLDNVSCEVKQRDFNTLAKKLVDGDITTGPDFYLIGWGNATFDASQTIIPCLTSEGVLTSYKNEELDSLIDQANSTADQSQRDELLQQANDHCHDQAPWIYLNRQYSVYGASSRIEWEPRNDERIHAYSIERSTQ